MISDYPDHFEVWCGPCEQRMTFAQDGIALLAHSRRHGLTPSWSEEAGFHIGEPPTIPVMSKDDILNWHDAFANAPDEIWSAATRLAVLGQDTRTTVRVPRS